MAGPKRRAAREPLSRDRIETAAFEVIERDGLEGFSTRKLATELGCEAMSIYHYFPSKAHLMDALVDRAASEFVPPPADLPWPQRLLAVSRAYRDLALRRPRFFQFLALHRMNTAQALALIETVASVFRDAGFDAETAARLFRIWGYYITGAALDETGGYAKGPSALEPVPAEVAARDYPAITAFNPYFKPRHHEATFALGLDILLQATVAMAPKPPQAGRRRAAKAIIR